LEEEILYSKKGSSSIDDERKAWEGGKLYIEDPRQLELCSRNFFECLLIFFQINQGREGLSLR